MQAENPASRAGYVQITGCTKKGKKKTNSQGAGLFRDERTNECILIEKDPQGDTLYTDSAKNRGAQ
jgi:hypothetical protein